MMKRFAALLSILTISLATISYAATAGAQFLKIGVDARALALGGATALADDAASVYWNPAGLGDVRTSEISFSHSQWLEGTGMVFAAAAYPLRSGAVVGLGAANLAYGDIPGRDENRAATAAYGARDAAVTVAYSDKLSDGLSWGVGLKYISQSIENESASGAALDAGIKSAADGGFFWAASARNIGAEMKFIEEGYKLPLSVSLGAGYDFGSAVLLSADVSRLVYDEKTLIGAGVEYSPFSYAAIRGGITVGRMDVNADISDLTMASGVNMGIGLNLAGVSFDYALVPYGLLGPTHHLTLTLQFGNK